MNTLSALLCASGLLLLPGADAQGLPPGPGPLVIRGMEMTADLPYRVEPYGINCVHIVTGDASVRADRFWTLDPTQWIGLPSGDAYWSCENGAPPVVLQPPGGASLPAEAQTVTVRQPLYVGLPPGGPFSCARVSINASVHVQNAIDGRPISEWTNDRPVEDAGFCP